MSIKEKTNPGVIARIKKILVGDFVETGATASQNIGAGKFFVWRNKLKQAKSAISSGDTFTEGTNMEAVAEGALNALNSNFSYTAGDEIIFTDSVYWYGLSVYGSLYINLSLPKPIKASGFNFTDYPTGNIVIGTPSGSRTVSITSVTQKTILPVGIQVVLKCNGLSGATDFWPVIVGFNGAKITFT